ncbi:MAG: hypothetical protein ACI87W_003202 [Halieaceae bacterium]|jgi:hypothetical protein
MSTLSDREKSALNQKLRASGAGKVAVSMALAPTLEKLSAQDLTAIMTVLKGANPVPTLWITCETGSIITNEKG